MSRGASSVATWGVLGQFSSGEELVRAARLARDAGLTRIDAYSPSPVDGLSDALDLRPTRLPLVAFAGGAFGCVAALAFQAWVAAVDYPQNIGGRPDASWPSFVPVTFEATVLCASIATVLGFFASCGLPHPYHPLFNVPQFDGASRDGFFLCIEAREPRLDVAGARAFLESSGATFVAEVPE